MKRIYDSKNKKYVLTSSLKRTSLFIIKLELSYVKNGYSITLKHNLTFMGIMYTIDFSIYNKFIEDDKEWILSKGRQVQTK